MAIDITKFLDQQGVSTLWGKVVENVTAEKERAEAAEAAALKAAQDAQADVDNLEKLVGTLPEGTTAATVVEYVNKKTEGIATSGALAELQAQVSEHGTSLATLEGDVNTVGSVSNVATTVAAAKVAEIVAGADKDFDTLKEVADWILSDTTGAAALQTDVATLKELVGSTAVATQIANAIDAALKVDGVDKYALASDLTSLATRVKALEDAGHVTQTAIDTALGTAKTYAEEKAAAAQSAAEATAAADAATKAGNAEANAKAYADGLAANYATKAQGEKADTALQAADIATGSTNGSISVKSVDVAIKGLGSAAYKDETAFDVAGTAASKANTALESAKAYTDVEVGKIQALTSAEVLTAINGTSGE